MQQRRNIIDQGLGRLLLVIFILMIFFNHSSRAEDLASLVMSGGNQQSNGMVDFNNSIISGMSQGKVSPVLQLVLSQSTMNACAKKALKAVGKHDDPHLLWVKKFNDTGCKLHQCAFSAVMIGMLPELSSNPRNGGSSSKSQQQGALMKILTLKNAFEKATPGCPKNQGTKLDPAMLAILTSMGGGGSAAGLLSGM